jgi:hypothetical protein
MNEEKSTMIRAASLWRGTTAGGNEFFSGNWGGVRVLIFAARNRKGPKSPDYYMFLAEQRPLDRPAGEDASSAANDQSEVDSF